MDIRGAGPACPRFQETVLTLGGSVPLLPLTNSSPCAARGQGPPSEALLRRDAWGGHVGPCFCSGLIFCYVFVWVSFWSDPCLSRCCPSATATRTAGVFCSLCGSGVRPCSPPRPLSHAAPFRFRTHARPFASASSCLCGAARDHPRAACWTSVPGLGAAPAGPSNGQLGPGAGTPLWGVVCSTPESQLVRTRRGRSALSTRSTSVLE